jgi:hypothetical protein
MDEPMDITNQRSSSVHDLSRWLPLLWAVIVASLLAAISWGVQSERQNALSVRLNAIDERTSLNTGKLATFEERILNMQAGLVARDNQATSRMEMRNDQITGLGMRLGELEKDRLQTAPLLATISERLRALEAELRRQRVLPDDASRNGER